MIPTLKQLKNNITPFLEYRKQVGYTGNTTARSDAVDLKLYINFMEQEGKGAPNGRSMIGFQKYLAQARKNKPASINRKIFTLRAFQSFLELKNIKDAANLPFKKVLKIRAPRDYRPNFLSQNEMNTLFSSINTNSVLGLRDYAIYAMMFLLGLRVGEVHQLNLNSIEWYDNKLTVNGKGNVKRTLCITDQMKTILENYLEMRNKIYNAQKTQALFVSKKGRRIAIRTIEDNFRKLIKVANIQKPFNVTPHTLRHTCATMLNEKEVKILTIQNILGHSNPNTTMNYYLHTPEHIMRRAMEKLPLAQFVNQMIDSGQIQLTFQTQRYRNTG